MAVQPLASQVGVAPACRALGVPRASFYRRQRPAPGHQQPRPTPARALCASERAHVLDVLASPRFVDRSPAEVVATLLDEGQYLCAERTMYRILAANQPVRERRNQRSHPCYTKPELVATGPNQTWSWDITRLRGPKRWTSFYLYVLLDIFSRCVVGWMVADRENAALAATLIEETCLKQGIEPQVLTTAFGPRRADDQQVHRPTPRRLGVTRSLSRPQVSDDNPFSEAQFKTLKYHPRLPWALRRHYRRHRLLPVSSSPGTTPSTAMPGSRCSPPMMSIITGHRMCWLSADVPCKPPGPFTPNASSTAPRNPPRFPKPSGSTHPPLPQQEKRVSK